MLDWPEREHYTAEDLIEIRERAERQGINPRTREPITIAASRSIVFKPGKALKDTL